MNTTTAPRHNQTLKRNPQPSSEQPNKSRQTIQQLHYQQKKEQSSNIQQSPRQPNQSRGQNTVKKDNIYQESPINSKNHKRKHCSMDLPAQYVRIIEKRNTENGYRRRTKKAPSQNHNKNRQCDYKQFDINTRVNAKDIKNRAIRFTEGQRRQAGRETKNGKYLDFYMQQYRKGKIDASQFKRSLAKIIASGNQAQSQPLQDPQLSNPKPRIQKISKQQQRSKPHPHQYKQDHRHKLDPQVNTNHHHKRNQKSFPLRKNSLKQKQYGTKQGSLVETVIHIKDFDSSIDVQSKSSNEFQLKQNGQENLLSQFSKAYEQQEKSSMLVRLTTSKSIQQFRQTLQTCRAELIQNTRMVYSNTYNSSKPKNQEVIFQQVMAIRIQRAWKQHKTRKMIGNIVLQMNQKLQTQLGSQSSFIHRVCDNNSYEFYLTHLENKKRLEKEQRREKKRIKCEEKEKEKPISNGKGSKNDSEQSPNNQMVSHQKNRKSRIMKMIQIAVENGSLEKQKQCLNDILQFVEQAQSTMKEKGLKKSKQPQPNPKYCEQLRSTGNEGTIIANSNDNQTSTHVWDDNQKLGLDEKRVFYNQISNEFQSILYGVPQRIENSQSGHEQLNGVSVDYRTNSQEYNLNTTRNNIRVLDFDIIENMLNNRRQKLYKIETKELSSLLHEFQDGVISEEKFRTLRMKMKGSYKRKLQDIKRAKISLQKGYRNVKSILEKQSKTFYGVSNIINCRREADRIDKITAQEPSLQPYWSSQLSSFPKSISQTNLQKKLLNFKNYLQQQQYYENQSLTNSKKKVQKDNNFHMKVQQNDDEQFMQDLIDLRYQQFQQQFPEIQKDKDVRKSFELGQYNKNLIQQRKVDQESQKAFLTETGQISTFNNPQNQKIEPATEINLFTQSPFPENSTHHSVPRHQKQSIFEYIFLDLCLQPLLQLSKQSRITQAIKNHMQFIKKVNSIPKGVKTNLQAVKQYLKMLQEYVIENYQDQLVNLECPIGPNTLEMLRYMHDFQDSDDGSQANLETITLVLPPVIFQSFQRQYEQHFTGGFEQCFLDESRQQSRRNFLKSVLHVHHKAIYDCLNQFLDYQRCFGIWGRPFPWKPQLSQSHYTLPQKKIRLQKSITKVTRTAGFLSGLLLDKQDSLLKQHSQFVNQDYLKQIREDRLAKMLANDLLQTEDRWVFYDDQETQVLIQAASFIFGELRREIVKELMEITAARHNH